MVNVSRHLKSNQVRSGIFALLAALIWGLAFVAQKTNSGGTFTFISKRSIIGVTALGLIQLIRCKFNFKLAFTEESKKENHLLWRGGIIVGCFLVVASFAQQFGMDLGTDAGKTGFITAFYMIVVPIANWIFFKKKANKILWVSVAISIVGMFLLCVKTGFSIEISDFVVLVCSFLYSGHIVMVGKVAPKADTFKLSFIQFLTVAVISTIIAVIFEGFRFTFTLEELLPILYLGIFSWGAGFTLQVAAQKAGNTNIVALIMSLESVFGAIFSAIILKERMSFQEYLGAFLVIGAVVLVELFEKEE